MTTHTFTFLKSFLVRPYISVHRFKKLVQLLPVKIRKFSCLIFGAYVFALTDCGQVLPDKLKDDILLYVICGVRHWSSPVRVFTMCEATERRPRSPTTTSAWPELSRATRAVS